MLSLLYLVAAVVRAQSYGAVPTSSAAAAAAPTTSVAAYAAASSSGNTGSCAGKSDGRIACVDGKSYVICTGGMAALGAAPFQCPQSSAPFCCEATNSCGYSACAAAAAPGSAAPAATATGGYAAVVTVAANTGSCSGKADGKIACTDANRFVTCSGGAAAFGAPIVCPAGSPFCCESTNSCGYSSCQSSGYVAAPPPPVTSVAAYSGSSGNTGSCSGKPDGKIACSDANRFVTCSGGVAAFGAPVTCPAGSPYCCEATNSCGYTPCQATSAPAASPVASVAASNYGGNTGSCANKADGKIACTDSKSFVTCSGGAAAFGGPTACPASAPYCCESTNSCGYASCGSSPAYVPPSASTYNGVANTGSCTGKPNGNIACVDGLRYVTCSGGYPAGGAAALQCPSTTPFCCEASNSCGYTSCQATGSSYTNPTISAPPYSNSNAANTGSCANKLNNQIACVTSSSFGICSNGALANNALQSCPSGTVCCEALGQCAYSGCAQAGGYQQNTQYTLPANANTGSCQGKADGKIACLPNNQFAICSNSAFAGVGSQTCPAGTVCCESLNRCDYTCGSVYTATPAYTLPYTAPTSCVNVPDNYIIPYGTSASGAAQFSICKNGMPTPAQSCPAGQVVCSNLNRCDWPGCYTYSPPSNVCNGKANNYVYATGTTTFNYCWNGMQVQAASQICPLGLVFCENLQRCDYTGCAGSPSVNPGKYIPPTTSPTIPYTPSCAGVPDNQITCINGTSFQICLNQQLYQANPQSCAPGTVCCVGVTTGCGWPGCAQAATTKVPIYTNGPSIDYCDDNGHDYFHMGKFCVGTRSNMWCQDGQLSRINFCPSSQICCENTGECGNGDSGLISGKPCYVSKNIPKRNVGCVGQVNSCQDLADGARVCTGDKTFSYCIDQSVFAPLNQMCPIGKKCCPSLGGRCEEDCAYPTTPVGDCSNQPDGASVCSGYKSYKICHNGGCLGTFDCTGSNMVCCPTSGVCTPKGQCDSSNFFPVVDNTCQGLLNQRVCSKDKKQVILCLNGHMVAKFPATAGYNFGCDDDDLMPDQSLYN